MTKRLPTYFLSHGGGPWPYMTGPFRAQFAKLEASLKQVSQELGYKPKAVLVVSGHWEANDFAVMSSARPPMVYDYSGFPEELYRIRYPAPGAPELAPRVATMLEHAGLPTHLDDQQGFDHGTFSMLAVMYPEADVPVLQVAMRKGYDPAQHMALGRALAPLRDEDVLIIGSGYSYHNFQPRDPERDSIAFDAWLKQTLVDSEPAERTRRLLDWEQAPSARAAHPREDHLVPLFVAAGAAENEPGQQIYREEKIFGAITASSYRFG